MSYARGILKLTDVHTHARTRTHTHTHAPLSVAREFSDYRLQEGGRLRPGGVNVALNSTVTRGCITVDAVNDRIPESLESFTMSITVLRSVSEGVQANLVLNPNH